MLLLHLVRKFIAHTGFVLAVEEAWGKVMHLTYAKVGITQEDSRFDFVRRMMMILAYSCSLTYLLNYFKKDLRVF